MVIQTLNFSVFLAIRSTIDRNDAKGKIEGRKYLVREDIETLFRTNNESITTAEIDKLMNEVFEIEKTDGKIYFENFYRVMKDVVSPQNLKLF